MNLKQLIKAGLTVRDGYVLDQLTTSDDIMMTDLSGGIMAKAHITQVVDKLVQLRLVVRDNSLKWVKLRDLIKEI
jgi:hypothetical protein